MYKKFRVVLITFLSLCLVTVFLVMDNIGVQYEVTAAQMEFVPDAVLEEKKEIANTPKTCLLLSDSRQENHEIYTGHMKDVLDIMRVGYDAVDLAKQTIPDFSVYKTAVVCFQDLDALAQSIESLSSWISEDGGRLMFFCTPTAGPVFSYFMPLLGVEDGGVSFAYITGIKLMPGFMIGSDDGFVFNWEEPVATTMSVSLNDTATVYAVSDDEDEIPLIWSSEFGKGRLVIMNHGISEKSSRGLSCAAYSLLEDTCVYPVINASSFFLDDFPSPVPMGDGSYIRQYYNRDISSFYSNVWWPDMLKLCDTYGVKYTGVIIENYDENTDGVMTRQTDRERFNHFGAMLLDHGGEIGIHGYNHLPLCFSGFDFKDKVDYKTWSSEADACNALDEVFAFTKDLFPENQPQVYVPPSNILSDEGRQLLSERYPQIKVISSLYLEGEIEYSQEFEVADDGVIEYPRVISGCILDQFDYWAAINALNLFYVNTHFMHPDDTLDPDRGAEMGWGQMYENFSNYMQWLYSSAPNIRNLIASDGGAAVQRFDTCSVVRTETETGFDLRLGGFWDEAYLMVRCNGEKPVDITGGTIERISGDHWLLHATSANISVTMESLEAE